MLSKSKVFEAKNLAVFFFVLLLKYLLELPAHLCFHHPGSSHSLLLCLLWTPGLSTSIFAPPHLPYNLYTAAGEILLSHKDVPVIPALKIDGPLFQTPQHGLKGCTGQALARLTSLSQNYSPSSTLWPIFKSKTTQCPLPPQGLCTCCSHCPEGSSQISTWLTPPPPLVPVPEAQRRQDIKG